MKRKYEIIFLCCLCISVTPLHSMLVRARRGVQEKSQIGRRNIFGKTSQQAAIAKSSPKTFLEQARSWLAQKNIALKNAFSSIYQSWWKKEPAIVVQKEIAVPVVPIPQEPTIIVQEQPKTTVKTPAQIEAEDILAKLNGPNPWSYSEGVSHNIDFALKSSLAEKIRNFFCGSC